MIEVIVLAGVVVILGVIGLIMFLDVRDAERRCANARVDAQLNAGKLAIAMADVETWKDKANAEGRRADALDDLIAKHAGSDAGPVAGSMERLLSEWRSASEGTNASGSAGPSAVPPKPAAAAPDAAHDLIKPGDV